MKRTNKKLSITTRAKRSSGKIRCDKCNFYRKCCVSRYIAEVCNMIYVKAYVKGYKQSTKDHKN